MKEAYQEGYIKGCMRGRNGQAEYDAVLAEAEKTVELSKTAFQEHIENAENSHFGFSNRTAERILVESC